MPQPEEPLPAPRSRRRIFIGAAVLALVVLASMAVGREIIRNYYYVSDHNGTVSIMRGVQGSFLGFSLQEPYLFGCLNARDELSLISAEQSQGDLDCRLLAVNDMRPSERAQVIAGLPSGSLDEAISQIEELSRSSVLPVCAPPPPPPTSTVARTPAAPTAPSPTAIPASPAPSAPAPSTTVLPETAAPGSNPRQAPRTVSPTPPSPPSTTTPRPTVTALPPPPPEPGTNCREVA